MSQSVPNSTERSPVSPTPGAGEHRPDSPKPGSPLHAFARFLLRWYRRLLIMFVLYVASIGPMYWTCFEAYNMDGSTFVAQLYFPIALACEESPRVAAWVNWYVGLWIF